MFKLNNPILKGVLEKHLSVSIPTSSANSVSPCCDECMAKIQDALLDAQLWMAIGKTSDSQGRYVVHVIIGSLDSNKYESPYPVSVSFMEQAPKSSDICKLANDTLRTVVPRYKSENFRIFISDGAPHMLKAGKTLKGLFPFLRHVTCVCQALHNLAEELIRQFPHVIRLIGKTKKVFLKAPKRLAVFRDCCSDIQLPPSQ